MQLELDHVVQLQTQLQHKLLDNRHTHQQGHLLLLCQLELLKLALWLLAPALDTMVEAPALAVRFPIKTITQLPPEKV
jgi:hypothetical protein